ncbi:hypothetical protein SK128_004044, partial [Halocaridina rubra]
ELKVVQIYCVLENKEYPEYSRVPRVVDGGGSPLKQVFMAGRMLWFVQITTALVLATSVVPGFRHYIWVLLQPCTVTHNSSWGSLFFCVSSNGIYLLADGFGLRTFLLRVMKVMAHSYRLKQKFRIDYILNS